jgi:putative transposase
MMKKLREEGISIGRYKVRSIMRQLNLIVVQRVAYKVTTKRKHSHLVADNILNQEFNPVYPNKVWAGDITYLRTNEGWLYLAIVMDLYSRRIIGWSMNKRMTTDLVEQALTMAMRLREPDAGLIFHSDRGSQYTGKSFQKLLNKHQAIPSMSGRGACLDNAVVERFFGSLKNEWLLKVQHLTREGMKKDVQQYIKYYNHDRLHTSNGDISPVNFELSLKKVSGWS